MSKLKVAEWNINNSCGHKDSYTIAKFVSKHLLDRSDDVIILTEFIQENRLLNNAAHYDDFYQSMSEKYIVIPYYGRQNNGVAILLKKNIFSEITKIETDKLFDNDETKQNITPDFLHVAARTNSGIIINIIGLRIRTAEKDEIKKSYTMQFACRKIQIYNVLKYISDNNLHNVIIMGDFNHGAIKNNLNDYKETEARYNYNYHLIDYLFNNLFPEHKYKLYTPAEDFSVMCFNNPYAYDHLITDLCLSNNEIDYKWDFMKVANETKNVYPEEKDYCMLTKDDNLYITGLPDHAILEATIKLNDTEEDE
jgi:hypothetical protein